MAGGDIAVLGSSMITDTELSSVPGAEWHGSVDISLALPVDLVGLRISLAHLGNITVLALFCINGGSAFCGHWHPQISVGRHRCVCPAMC